MKGKALTEKNTRIHQAYISHFLLLWYHEQLIAGSLFAYGSPGSLHTSRVGVLADGQSRRLAGRISTTHRKLKKWVGSRARLQTLKACLSDTRPPARFYCLKVPQSLQTVSMYRHVLLSWAARGISTSSLIPATDKELEVRGWITCSSCILPRML